MKILQSYWDTVRYIYFVLDPVRGLVLLLSITLIIVSSAELYLDPSNIPFFAGAAVISTGVSIYQSLNELFKSQKVAFRWNDTLKRELPQLRPSPREEKDGFEVVSDSLLTDSAITYSRKFNDFLLNQQNDFNLTINEESKKRLFRLLRSRKDVLSPILRQKWWISIVSDSIFINESKVSVASPIRTDINEVKLFKGDYFSSFLTNELSLSRVIHEGAGRPFMFYDGSRLFPQNILPNIKCLKEFDEYISGNHIGASTIAVSSDKYLCLWIQTPKAQQSVGLLAPTGSGSLNWSDVKDSRSLKQVVIAGMNREFHEESNRRGVKLSVSQIEETILIGYFRRLVRGGKPEFVAISRLTVPHTTLEPNDEEVEDRSFLGEMNHYPVMTFSDLKLTVQSLLRNESNRQRLSVPLWANLLALNDIIVSKPDFIKGFLKIQ